MPSKWSPYLLSVLRIVAALLFFEHGTQKLFGYPPGQPYTGFPIFPCWALPECWKWPAVFCFCWAFSRVLLRSFSPARWRWVTFEPTSIAASFPINNGGEITVMLCFFFLYLSAAGPGPLALSNLLKQKR